VELLPVEFSTRCSPIFASPFVVLVVSPHRSSFTEPTAERTLGYTPDPDDPLSSAFGSLLSDVTG
jgi:hypothetical protein